MDTKTGFHVEMPEVSGGRAHSKYALFLIEQLIVILIFAVCAAVCVKIFADSYIMAQDSSDMNHALTAAESAAECFKSAGNNPERLAELLNGSKDESGVIVCYNKDWMHVSDRENVVYTLSMKFRESTNNVELCDITVNKADDKDIITITAAARR